jgi:type IV pilus assembly protein PilQ
MNKTARWVWLLAGVLAVAGCAGLDRRAATDAQATRDLAKARQMFQQGNVAQAMIQCIDLARRDPDMPGLAELQTDIGRAIHKGRARDAELRKSLTTPRMVLDSEQRLALPDTYGLRRHVAGETTPLRTPSTKMEEVLRRRVNVHLDNVNLNAFVLAIGASENVNIIVDGTLAQSDRTMTLHADSTPLIEILDYASRNLEVTFSVGANIIWATQRQSTAETVPMETRVYRLRKGISGEEVSGGDEGIDIIKAIERFVPKADGADLLFNKKAHVLMVKNTRDSLAKIEDIIEALDVAPPQVLIEARFITTSIDDLSELGVDWFLNSPVTVTTKKVWKDGRLVSAPSTVIDKSAEGSTSLNLLDFPNKAMGLNLSYRGVLTDPMFQAILHALEQSGKSRTLSVPRVTTVNNSQARIRIGKDFRYFEEFQVESVPSTTDSGQTIYRSTLVPVGTPQLKELGIELEVTPSVGADMRSIRLHMLPKITSDQVDWIVYETAGQNRTTGTGSATGSGTNMNSLIKLPIFASSELETEMVVRSGETVVMGGLITSRESKKLSKVPILSSIPILGRLFTHDMVEEKKENLLIFVTATVISETGESLIPLDEIALPAPAEPAGAATSAAGTETPIPLEALTAPLPAPAAGGETR